MRQRSPMRVGIRPPKVEWRVIAVDDADPVSFAQHLQESFQKLSEEGFNILAQMGRNGAHILVANRMIAEVTDTHPAVTLPAPPPLAPLAPLGRALAMPSSDEKITYHYEKVIYHYLSPEGATSQQFTTMVEALRLIRTHIDGDGSLVPGYVVAMAAKTFEAPQLTTLLREYAEELALMPVKQVD